MELATDGESSELGVPREVIAHVNEEFSDQQRRADDATPSGNLNDEEADGPRSGDADRRDRDVERTVAPKRPTTRAARKAEKDRIKLAGRSRRRHSGTATFTNVEAIVEGMRQNGASDELCSDIVTFYATTKTTCNAKCLVELARVAPAYHNVEAPPPTAKGNGLAIVGDSLRATHDRFLCDLYDPNGNMPYCNRCVQAIFQVGPSRLADVAEETRKSLKNLGYELKPKGELFKEPWRLPYIRLPRAETSGEAVHVWENMDCETMVEVRRIARVHGLRGKPSNRHKALVDQQTMFIKFIENNSTPSARTTTDAPEHYLDDRFTRWSSERLREASSSAPADSDDDDLDPPPEDEDVVDSEDEEENFTVDASNADSAGDEATGAAAEDDRDDLQNSVYDEFVKSLKEGGTSTGFLSERTFFRWKILLCRGVKISPHRSDYCDTCKSLTVRRRELQAVVRRMQDGGSATGTRKKEVKDQLASVRNTRLEHRAIAARERDAYNESVRRSRDAWAALERARGDERLALQKKFVAVVSTDFMQERVLPHFGGTAQPGRVYYRMKFSIHVSGTVLEYMPRLRDGSIVYLTDEYAHGPKSGDHQITYLEHLFDTVLPAWVEHVELWTDNAATIKSQFLAAYLADCVARKRFVTARQRHMMAGHTKFAPDRLFAAIGRKYRTIDVYNVNQLKELVANYAARVEEMKVGQLKKWRESVKIPVRPTKLRELHSITYRLNEDQSTVEMSTAFSNTDAAPATITRLFPLEGYVPLAPLLVSEPHGITPEKMSDLQKSYDEFVPSDKYLPFLRPKGDPTLPAPERAPPPLGRPPKRPAAQVVAATQDVAAAQVAAAAQDVADEQVINLDEDIAPGQVVAYVEEAPAVPSNALSTSVKEVAASDPAAATDGAKRRRKRPALGN